MNNTEKLLIGIENVLEVANEIADDLSRLKIIEDEFIMLKEQLFMSQFTDSEKQIFALAIDGHSILEMQDILFKEESTIKIHRRNILQKLNASSMQEAVKLYEEIAQESHRKFNFNVQHSSEKLFAIY